MFDLSYNRHRSPARDSDEITRPSDHHNPAQAVDPAFVRGELTHAIVEVLLCPGPRFVGASAVRFARSVWATCQVKPYVVLDLSEVDHVDVGGLLAITALARASRSAGNVLRLCSPRPGVRGLLASTGMQRLVDVYHVRLLATVVESPRNSISP